MGFAVRRKGPQYGLARGYPVSSGSGGGGPALAQVLPEMLVLVIHYGLAMAMEIVAGPNQLLAVQPPEVLHHHRAMMECAMTAFP